VRPKTGPTAFNFFRPGFPASEPHPTSSGRLIWINRYTPESPTLRCAPTPIVAEENAEDAMKKTNVAALAVTAILLLASVSLDAGASVVYTWQPVNEKVPYIPPDGRCSVLPQCGLVLEVTDAAFNAGLMNYSFAHTYQGASDPESPIISLFSVSQLLRPQGYDPPSDWIWYIDANVQFGDYMTGNLSINDGENSYSMNTHPDGRLWTVYGFNSDDPDWGCYYSSCSGALGYWALGSAPAPIPAPEPDLFAAFGLLAFALLGADTARRWRRKERGGARNGGRFTFRQAL